MDKNLPEDALYIVNFENDGGFAALAADDRIDPILCITERGNLSVFDLMADIDCPLAFEDMYDADTEDFIAWIGPGVDASDGSAYVGKLIRWTAADLFEEAVDGGGTGSGNPPDDNASTVNYSVKPMLKTKWDQNPAPYNSMCYVINGRHAPAGCVAVAIAQIMAYHKKPALICRLLIQLVQRQYIKQLTFIVIA